MLIFTLTTFVEQTSGRCSRQLAKMNIKPLFADLTADLFRRMFEKIVGATKVSVPAFYYYY